MAKVEAALEANVVDEDQLIEERRRRRQEILAKHQQDHQAAPAGAQACNIRVAVRTATALHDANSVCSTLCTFVSGSVLDTL